MIAVTFYNNGYEINGHSRVETCYQVSILAWSCANTMSMNGYESDYYTSDYDKSNAGYTYLTFDTDNAKAVWVFNEFITNLTHWKNFYWSDNEVSIIHQDKILVISPDFKTEKGIAVKE